ncbi:MAG: hypothetical protein KC431_29555, partial [Myxococcales bacterium]|nr:hypothetical protein [Myxococcales bacterium]
AHVPTLQDVARLGLRPEAAVLSAVFHGRDPRCLAVLPVAYDAIAPLATIEPKLYQDYRYLIRTATGETMSDREFPNDEDRIPLEFEDEPPGDEPVTQWEFEGLHWTEIRRRVEHEAHEEGCKEGRQEGRQEGRATLLEALREALLAMLDLRGLTLSPTETAVVKACEDPDRLRVWIAGVKGCRSVAEILAID